MFALALGLLLLADIYFVVTTLVDLSPFNNVTSATPRERATEVSINAPVMAIPAVLVVLAAALSLPLLAYLAGAVELLVALGGLSLWWLPYLVGVTVPWATAGTGESWAQLHGRTYAKTIIVLPRIGERPRPNLEHMVLHTIVLAGAVAAFVYAAAM